MNSLPNNLAAFSAGYIACALWLAHDDGENADLPIDPHSHALMDCDARAFAVRHLAQLTRALETCATWEPPSQPGGWHTLGHLLWLNRNGHGAGYWDRGLGTLGEQLSEAATALGETSLYTSDDGETLYHYPPPGC